MTAEELTLELATRMWNRIEAFLVDPNVAPTDFDVEVCTRIIREELEAAGIVPRAAAHGEAHRRRRSAAHYQPIHDRSKRMKPTKHTGHPVMVTTAHRGVFFGYAAPGTAYDADTITLTDVRNCLYWSADVKGFIGLAVIGPTKSCRIGPAAPRATLRNLTSVIEVTDDAARSWDSAPWSK